MKVDVFSSHGGTKAQRVEKARVIHLCAFVPLCEKFFCYYVL